MNLHLHQPVCISLTLGNDGEQIDAGWRADEIYKRLTGSQKQVATNIEDLIVLKITADY